MSYDIKYRKRAITYQQEGHTYEETAKVFGISPNTLNTWEKQHRKTGSLERSYRQYTLKVTAAELEAYLALHPDAYQYEMSKKSRATYALLPEVKQLLLDIRAEKKRNKKLFGKAYVQTDYIFVWPDGHMIRPDYVTHRFQKVLENKGLPVALLGTAASRAGRILL